MSQLVNWNGWSVVNTTVESQQYWPSVSALPDGGYVTAWVSRSDPTTDDWWSSRDIHAQRFSASGAPVGPETVLEGSDGYWDEAPHVLGLRDGGWFLSWLDDGAGGSSTYNAFGRFFDVDGTPRGDRINLGGGHDRPAVAQLADDRVLVTWTGYSGSDLTGIKAAVLNLDGSMASSPFTVSHDRVPQESDYSGWVEAAALRNGGFVIAYQYNPNGISGDFGDTDSGIWARVFNADASPARKAFPVNSTTAGADHDAQVAALANGGFVVTWTSAADGSDQGVRGQIFNDNGSPRGGEFLVNSTTAFDQYAPETVGLSDGGFALIWTSDYQGIMGQLFTRKGNPVGGEVRLDVEGPTSSALIGTSATLLADGRIAIVGDQGAWTPGDVYTSIVDPRGTSIDGTGASETVFGNLLDNTIRGLGGNDLVPGMDGNDTLSGGTGRDILRGGTGGDRLVGGSGNDRLFGEAGNDRLEAGKGQDHLVGGGGNDFLTGGAGADTFAFDTGRDTVTDFENDLDTMELNHKLWAGDMTAQEVVDSFGSIAKGNAVLDFGDGNKLKVLGVTDLADLYDDIAIG